MTYKLSSMLAVLLFAVLVLLIYLPLFEADSSLSISAQVHQMDSMKPGIEGTLTFCSDVWPPYVNAYGSGRKGYVIDLLREIYEPLGYEVNLEILPWSQCLQQVNSGRVTGVIGVDKEKAPGLIFPDETITGYRLSFYTLAQAEWAYQGPETLKGLRLGVVEDYSYPDELDAYIEEYRQTDRILLGRGEQAVALLLTALQAGRLDAFVADPFSVDALLNNKSEAEQNLRKTTPFVTDEKIYVAFGPSGERSLRLRQSYDRRINRLRNGGSLAKPHANYNLESWQLNSAQTTQSQRGAIHH